MSQENVEIAKAAASALREGDPWSHFVTTDYTWDMSTAPGMWPEAQTHTGIEAVERFVRGWIETFDGGSLVRWMGYANRAQALEAADVSE